MRISVVGLGKVGVPLVAVLAAGGYEVVGIDLSPAVVERINAGISPIQEPEVQPLLTAHHARISATVDWAGAIAGTQVTFIIVPTPSGEDGGFRNDHILDAVNRLGAALAEKDSYHLVVVNSTVMPGSMDGPIKSALEASSGRLAGRDFGLCYNPEFIALGSVISGLVHPDYVLVGELDKRSGDVLEGLYATMLGDAIPIVRMNLVNAELTKISVNAFLTTKISFANVLSEICAGIAGADVDVVTRAVGRDQRIGPEYLRGATAYGGPCFPRDTVAFNVMAQGVGVRANLAEATDAVNARQTTRLAGIVARGVEAGGRIAVLGLAYKPDTPVIERSVGIELAATLARSGYAVTVHDPLALEPARRVLGNSVSYASSARDAVTGSSATVIATAWPEYAGLRPAWFAGRERAAIIDCWRILEPASFAEHATIVHLGRSESIGVAEGSRGDPGIGS